MYSESESFPCFNRCNLRLASAFAQAPSKFFRSPAENNEKSLTNGEFFMSRMWGSSHFRAAPVHWFAAWRSRVSLGVLGGNPATKFSKSVMNRLASPRTPEKG